MSWHIRVYREEVAVAARALSTQAERDDYLEEFRKLPLFTEKQLKFIRDHLRHRGYAYQGSNYFEHSTEAGATAMLTDHALYFTGKGEGVMEITMTALEFASSLTEGGFAVYDPQEDRWD